MKMKNSLTIALGTIVGVLALCGLAALCLIGLTFVATLRSTPPTPISSVGIVPSLVPLSTDTPTAITTNTPASSSTPTLIGMATPVRSPTPPTQALGQSVVYGNVKTTIVRYEFSGAYQGSFMTEKPKAGFKFLWLYVIAENVGNSPAYLPHGSIGSQFYILYRGQQQIEPDPYVEERPGYSPYESVQAIPGVKREGWLRFSVPEQAQPVDLRVLFDAAGGPFLNKYYFWQLGK
jgi:hypothetical protein